MHTLDLVIDPIHPENVYATGPLEASCGSSPRHRCLGFRSTDAGESWTCMKGGDIALALDPSRPSMLLAGASREIFRSTNAGRTWRDLGAAFLQVGDRRLSDLILMNRSPETVYAATNRGPFKSIDGGMTWRFRGTGMPARPDVYDLAGSPSSPLVVYATVQKYRPVFQSYDGALYWTQDGATSWRPVALEGTPRGRFVQMQVHRSRPDILYAAPERGGLYRLILD